MGNYGANHRMAYTIVGRDANLAARLQSAAEVDEILISEDTHNLIKMTIYVHLKANFPERD